GTTLRRGGRKPSGTRPGKIGRRKSAGARDRRPATRDAGTRLARPPPVTPRTPGPGPRRGPLSRPKRVHPLRGYPPARHRAHPEPPDGPPVSTFRQLPVDAPAHPVLDTVTERQPEPSQHQRQHGHVPEGQP